MRWLGLLALIACADTQVTSGVAVRADGRAVVVEGERALRAMLIELEWDAGLDVTAVRAGDDAARLTLFETDFEPGAHRAKVVLADGRGVRLPARGRIITVDATGTGALRVLHAEGADDGPSAVDIEVRR